MNRRELLARAQKVLSDHKISDTSLEAELLLRHALKIDRIHLFADLDSRISAENERLFWVLISRRLKGEPTAYITGHREFYGLDLDVNSSVLIPRPETELLVEKTIEVAQKYPAPIIADIGTGSGAVAIALAYYLPNVKIYTVDISAEALRVARLNSQKYGLEERIIFLLGDLLQPLPEPVNIIAANLPYVLTGDLTAVNTIGFEPKLALDGGRDGLDLIRAICSQTKSKLLTGGFLLLEIGLGQREPLQKILKTTGLSSTFYTDLNGIDRVAVTQFE